MSDWMVVKYPSRFFHNWSIEEESRWCGGKPDYILKHPLYSVAENKGVDQIFVSGDDVNVRNKKNEVLKRAEKGYYNVLSKSEWALDGKMYTWYEVEKGKYIASVPSRVTFIPKQTDEVARLQTRITELENKLKEIELICSR